MRMYLALPDNLLEAADSAARERGLSRSAWIRLLVTDELARRSPPPKPAKPETPAARERRLLAAASAPADPATPPSPPAPAGERDTYGAWAEGVQALIDNRPAMCPGRISAAGSDHINAYFIGRKEAHAALAAGYDAGRHAAGASEPDCPHDGGPLAAAWYEGHNRGVVDRADCAVPSPPAGCTLLPSAWQRLYIEGYEAAEPDCPHLDEQAQAWWAGYNSKEA